ncbi:MAG: NUDIX hydrolase [Bacteroidetes bacterium]|nr:NUDIX hydrolase [Bacteroidota bacterium]
MNTPAQEPWQESLKYRQWREAMTLHGNTVGEVKPLSLIHKPNGELLFALLDAEMAAPEGNPYPRVLMLRGAFVVVVTVITLQETGEEFLLLVRQRRVADGDALYEHPAGMCDASEDPLQVAVKELAEETGLHLPREAFVQMNDRLLFTSPGLLDEGGWFFYVRHTLPERELQALLGTTLGNAQEQEFIQLHLATPQETLRLSRNITTLAATWMYLNRS